MKRKLRPQAKRGEYKCLSPDELHTCQARSWLWGFFLGGTFTILMHFLIIVSPIAWHIITAYLWK